MITRFRPFTDEELNAIESAFCNEKLKLEFLIEDVRKEKERREEARKWWSGENNE